MNTPDNISIKKEQKIPKVITKAFIIQKGKEARDARKEGRKICCCSSCGVIVQNNEGEFLLIERTKGALGFASVAGHGLDTKETYLESAKAELEEEVNIGS